MTYMWLILVTSDSTIFDPWNGSWKIKFYVIFLLFLPFFVTLSCFSLNVLPHPQGINPIMFPCHLGFQTSYLVGLLSCFTSPKSKEKCTVSYFIPPLPPVSVGFPRNSNPLTMNPTTLLESDSGSVLSRYKVIRSLLMGTDFCWWKFSVEKYLVSDEPSCIPGILFV